MAEEGERPRLVTRMKKHLKEAPFFCKIIELILCIVSTGLILGPFSHIPQEDLNHIGLFHVAVCGYILINGIFILSHLLGDKIPKKTALIFSLVGAILTCAAGLVLIRDWTNFPNNLISRYVEQYSDQMVSSGFLAVLAALVFILDAYFINKYN